MSYDFITGCEAEEPGTVDDYINALTPEERRGHALRLRKHQPCWLPNHGSPQIMAQESKADILLFGGAAGGGKSDLAIGLALTKHQRTLYIRKESTQLVPVEDRIAELLGSRKGYNGQKKVWRIPDTTRQIQLGGVNNPGDENAYQGNPRDLLVLDEVANIPEEQVRFLMGWVRSTVEGQRCRTLMCSNPPTGAAGLWLIEYFGPWLDKRHHHPAKPGELRWYAMIDGKDTALKSGNLFEYTQKGATESELIIPTSRTFIPSKVQDNPYLAGTSYMATLQALPEPLRSQMLLGDFMAGLQDDAWQVIPSAWIELAIERWEPRDVQSKQQMTSMGVDVSRGGKDESIISRRHLNWYDELVAIPGQDIPDGPTLGALVLQHRRDAAPVHVDAIGVGSSVVDFLRQQPIQCEPVTGSEKGLGKDKTGHFEFRNKRAQLIWQFREALDPVRSTVALPPDSQLKADLCAYTWRIAEGNKIIVRSKEEIYKDIQRSTDRGDAVIYASVDTQPRQAKSPMQHRHLNKNAKLSSGRMR